VDVSTIPERAMITIDTREGHVRRKNTRRGGNGEVRTLGGREMSSSEFKGLERALRPAGGGERGRFGRMAPSDRRTAFSRECFSSRTFPGRAEHYGVSSDSVLVVLDRLDSA